MRKLLLFLGLCGSLAAQTIPVSPGIFSLSGTGGGGGGSGTVGPGTTNTMAKFTASTTVGDSLLTDDATTLAYTGTGGFTTTGPVQAGVGGTTAGAIVFTQGTTQSTGTTNITFQAPAAVTSYIRTLPAAVGSTGFLLETVSGSLQTETLVSAIPSAFTATTQSVADNSTKIATTAYSDRSALAGMVGTYASPDTTGGAVTLTYAVTEVWTNTTTTYALPAVASSTGKGVIFYVVGSNVVTVDPNASEIIVRDGTPQTGGVTMTLTGTAGNYVCLVCDGTRWVTLGFKGTLAAGS